MAAGATHQTTVEESRRPWTTPVPQDRARMGRRPRSGWARAAGRTDGRRCSLAWRDFPCSSIIRHHAADRLAGPSRGGCTCATRNECKRDAGLASADRSIRHPAAIRSDLDHVAACVSDGPRFSGEILSELRTITDTRWTPVGTPGRPRQGAPPSNQGAHTHRELRPCEDPRARTPRPHAGSPLDAPVTDRAVVRLGTAGL